ncbi:MAG: PQQ-binding-like beta-propeller repeat protein [Thermomicrobiales bacterium]
MVRHPQAATHLSDYWNALDRGAPAEELDRLAALVAPSDLDTIHRARAMHQPHRPDPRFALRLEHMLMNAAAHPASQAIPLPRLPKGRSHVPVRPAVPLPALSPRTLAHAGSIALRIALILLLIALTATGIWLASRDNHHQIATPPVATPTVQVSPDVPMYRGNPARTGVFPGPALVGSPVELWKLQLTEPINLGAAVVDGRLYFPAGNNGFEAHDAMTGDLIWTFTTAAPAVSATAVVGGMAYVIDSDGTLYAVHAEDGSKAWQMANLNVRSSVAPVDGAVYAVSPEGTFSKLDAATGTVLWQTDIGAESRGGMAVDGGVAFQGNAAGVMTAMDTETGAVLWTFQNTEGRGNATVTVANGQIYITISGGDTNAMYAVDVKTGKQTWRQEQGPGAGFISATATPDRLYSVAEDGTLHALDAATGETVWTYQLQEFVRSIPVLVEGTLYVADNGGFVRAIDARTGVQEWEYPIAGTVDLGWPVVANGVLYIGTAFGNFYAITGSGMLAARLRSTPAAESIATPVQTGQKDALTVQSSVDWRVGGSDGVLGQPDGLAVAPDGTLWVHDVANAELLQIDRHGTLRESVQLNTIGAGTFDFSQPTGESYGAIAIDSDNNLYVLDMGNYRVVKLGPDRQFVLAFGSKGTGDGQFAVPDDVAVGSDGTVYVMDNSLRRVQQFTADGTFMTAFGRSEALGDRLLSPARFGVDREGYVYIADVNEVKVFGPDGTFVRRVGTDLLSMAIDVAIDADGFVYVTDAAENLIKVFDARGTHIGTIGAPGQFVALDAVAVDGDGGVYALDFEGKQITRFAVAVTPVAAATLAINDARVLWQSGPDAEINANMAAVGIGPDGITYALDGDHHTIAMFGPDGSYLGRWGKPGKGPGEFRFSNQSVTAGSIGFDANGNIYVFDSVNNRIQKFAPDRTFIKEWGSAGTARGQFNIPMGTVDAATGRVWVAEFGNNRVQVFDLDGNLLDAWGSSGSEPGQLMSPAAIAVRPDGTVYVAEEATRRIQHFTADGTFLGVLEQPETGTGVVYGMAVDASGNLWTSSVNPARVVVYRPDGTVVTSFDTLPDGEDLGVPAVLAISPDGTIAILALNGQGSEYSAQQHGAMNRILMLDFSPSAANQSSAGTARMAWESSDDVALLSHASGVTLAPDGTVWVADGANSRFQIFDQGGKLLDVWGEKGAGDGQFNFVRSSNGDGLGMVSFGPDGSIYVADTGNTRIQRFDRDGNFLNAWGSFGSGNGQFISPSTIAIDSQGHVFVSDDIRNDIQKFSADGTWLATFGGRGSAPGQLNYQGFIAIAPDDTLWVADPENRRIQHFANDGAFIAAIPFTAIPGKPDAGATIAVDGQGRVYFADIDHSRLFVLDAEGAVLGAWTLTRADGSPIPNSGGMVVGADGAIFIGDWANGTLYRYDLDPPLDSSNATPVATPGS